jgi:hypothetical protein
MQGLRHRRRSASGEGRNLRAFPWRRMAEGRAKDARRGQTSGASRPRNLRHGEAEEPPAWPGRGTSDVEATEDRRSGGGFEHSTGWSPRRGAHEGLVMWNYINNLGSVDCNMGICWDIPPPSRGISVIASKPYIKGAKPSLRGESILLFSPTVEPTVHCCLVSHCSA